MQNASPRLLICGIGYSGMAVATAALASEFTVTGTSRDPAQRASPDGIAVIGFENAGPAIAAATHLLVTAGPAEAGDPLLARHRDAIAAAPALRWIGYLSTIGVFGDRGGAWVDEDTEPAPSSERTRRRVRVEAEWSSFAADRAVDLFRVGGIYGPGRSAFDDLRAGTARRIVQSGHAFNRIHRDDIARAILAAMRQDRGNGARRLNLVDDEPAESAAVVEEAARLLGVDLPVAVPFAQAAERMSPMARSFWSESRLVSSAKTKAMLGIGWLYPTYREGLRAILAEERAQGPA